MSGLRVEGLCKRFGAQRAVEQVSFEVAPGELVCLLGSSGCGKSTLLMMIAGHTAPDAGAVWLNGRAITHAPPAAREIGMVFQSYALFPHLSAYKNISFGLEVRGLRGEALDKRVRAALAMVGLDEAQAARKPAALSGGQQQRVAVARALVIAPALLLLDEPFANLDARLREELRREARRLQRETGLPTLLVTHDQAEAMQVADRIAVMFDGQIVQLDAPERVYKAPRDRRVAALLGDASFLEVIRRDGALAQTRCGPLGVEGEGAFVMLRPEELELCRAEEATLWLDVTGRAFQGADTLLDGTASGEALRVRVRSAALDPETTRVPLRQARPARLVAP